MNQESNEFKKEKVSGYFNGPKDIKYENSVLDGRDAIVNKDRVGNVGGINASDLFVNTEISKQETLKQGINELNLSGDEVDRNDKIKINSIESRIPQKISNAMNVLDLGPKTAGEIEDKIVNERGWSEVTPGVIEVEIRTKTGDAIKTAIEQLFKGAPIERLEQLVDESFTNFITDTRKELMLNGKSSKEAVTEIGAMINSWEENSRTLRVFMDEDDTIEIQIADNNISSQNNTKSVNATADDYNYEMAA